MAPFKYTVGTLNKFSGLDSEPESSENDAVEKELRQLKQPEMQSPKSNIVSESRNVATSSKVVREGIPNNENALDPSGNYDGISRDTRSYRGSQRVSGYSRGKPRGGLAGNGIRRSYKVNENDDGTFSNSGLVGTKAVEHEGRGRRFGRGRELDRHSGSGRGREMKREGGGRYNWGVSNEEKAEAVVGNDSSLFKSYSDQSFEEKSVEQKASDIEEDGNGEKKLENRSPGYDESNSQRLHRKSSDEPAFMHYESWKLQQRVIDTNVAKKSFSGGEDTKKEMEAQGFKAYKKDTLKTDETHKGNELNGAYNEDLSTRRKTNKNVVDYLKPSAHSDSFGGRNRGRRPKGGRGGSKGGNVEIKEKFEYRVRDAPDLQDTRAFPALTA